MAHFAVASEAFKGCFQNWRLWLIQSIANLALFGLFTLWLLIPVASAWHLTLNLLLALFLSIATLTLHAGTLKYFSSREHEESDGLSEIFQGALRNLSAVAVCAAVLALVWYVAGIADQYADSLPNYLRSLSPAFVRNLLSLAFYEGLVKTSLFTLQWIAAPGLILPLLASASVFGFGGLGRRGFATWKNCVTNVFYWAVISLGAIVGVYVTTQIMGWTPDFRTSTLPHETASLIARGLLSYFLGLFAWMLVCSTAGRQNRSAGGTGDNVPGQTVA